MNLPDKIKSEILSRIVPVNQRKVGLEIEGFYYDSTFRRLPVNPNKHYSASKLFDDIQKTLKPGDSFSYSLEPGGQLEWASAPAISLWDIQKQFNRHVFIEDEICQKNKIDRLHLSLEPFYSPDEIDLIELKKYQLMNKLFLKTGKLGPWMMRNTTSVQLNIDYTSEQDANQMAFLADTIQPLFSILFSNSPFKNGAPVGTANVRWQIWEDTDPGRSGSLLDHGIKFQPKMIDDYAQWIPNVKAIFKYNESGHAEFFNGTLGEMILSEPNKISTHIISALHQSFTHVRFKNILEIRSSDRPPKGFEMAPAAFLMGLLTAPNIRERGIQIISNWSQKERKGLIRSAHDLSFNQLGPEKKSIGSWLECFSELALKGLDERAKIFQIQNERPLVQLFLKNVLKEGPKTIQIQNEYKKTDLSVRSFLKDCCLESGT